jgi:arabinogalactan endo-1,4-beta-galactosidase
MKVLANKLMLVLWLAVLLSVRCNKSENNTFIASDNFIIKGVDVSFIPEIRSKNLSFYNAENVKEEMLLTLKNAGVNTIRLRIWNNPTNGHSNLAEVKAFADEIKQLNIKVWLTVHYSDTWADPGAQTKPIAWSNNTFSELNDSVYYFTKTIVSSINPDYIQIGNEINNGFLWPEGSTNYMNQMVQLLQSGVKAVRDVNTNCKIMIHHAGYKNAEWFFSQIKTVDYDLIGISYYPSWHGKGLDTLQSNLINLNTMFKKPVVIAETSYPFTFGYNDWTNNIIGDSTQILPQFKATEQGQKEYMQAILSLTKTTPNVLGFCYWGADYVSFKGNQAKDGSSYENQAFWNFNNRALPVLEIYNK